MHATRNYSFLAKKAPLPANTSPKITIIMATIFNTSKLHLLNLTTPYIDMIPRIYCNQCAHNPDHPADEQNTTENQQFHGAPFTIFAILSQIKRLYQYMWASKRYEPLP
ncbi:MAG: hypothetical protein FWH42_04835 [Dehalococcoidia bacterium]|nr:hypothetical protein [Dehalococcoidia bacterium]